MEPLSTRSLLFDPKFPLSEESDDESWNPSAGESSEATSTSTSTSSSSRKDGNTMSSTPTFSDASSVEDEELEGEVSEERVQSRRKRRRKEVLTKKCDHCRSTVDAAATRCRYCRESLVIACATEGDGFQVVRQRSGNADGETISVVIVSDDLRNTLRQSGALRNARAMTRKNPHVTMPALFGALPSLRRRMARHPEERSLQALVACVERENARLAEAYNDMCARNVIAFDMLGYAFEPGSEVVAMVNGDQPLGLTVQTTDYSSNFFGTCFSVTGTCIVSNGTRLVMRERTFTIAEFKELKPLDELSVRPITPEMRARLVERGRIYVRYAFRHHHLRYQGTMLRRSHAVQHLLRHDATGRVTIDVKSMQRFDGDYPFPHLRHWSEQGYYCGDGDEEDDTDAIQGDAVTDESKLFCTWPTLCGFSFRLKDWCEFSVERLEEIEFDDDALQHIVLADADKGFVCSVVDQVYSSAAQSRRNDFIRNKGAGCVVLLYGPPGSGKTALVEALADYSHRPLYSVTVGELGTEPDVLEERLRDILDLAQAWGAIVLIDEIDIYTEGRKEGDLKRNAMIGIFLRLLEYHNGMLFLTTNRVQGFDDAFNSRIVLPMRFEALDATARAQVWTNHFELAGIPLEDAFLPTMLAETYPTLNGRQIRSVVRLATMQAGEEGASTIVERHLLTPLRHLKEFAADVAQ